MSLLWNSEQLVATTREKLYKMAVKLYLIQKRSISLHIHLQNTFNKFFVNIGNTLKIDKDKRFLVETNNVFDPVLKAIKKYSTHTSILVIKEKMNNNVFSFRDVTYEEILSEINSLYASNATQSEGTPFKITLIFLPILSNKTLTNAS